MKTTNKKAPKRYLQREVGEALNNATLAAGNTTTLASITEERRAKIGYYSKELMELLNKDVEDGWLTSEELAYAFSGAALMTHCLYVAKNLKLPAFQDLAKRAIIGEDE